MTGDGVGPGAVISQQSGQAGGQANHPGMLAGPGGMVQAGEQVRAFGPGPRQRPGAVRQIRDRDRRRGERGRGRPGPGLAGQPGLGDGGGVLVIIQQVLQPLVSLGGGVGGSQGPGVLAEQVVQPVPAAGRLGEQVLVVQGRQTAAGGTQIGLIQRGGGISVDVGAPVQPQAAEQPLLALGEVGVGQAERGRHRHVLRRHQLQPVPGRGQIGGQPGRGSRPDGGAAGGPASPPPAAGTRTAR